MVGYLFLQEVWDYIGSSRMAYDMNRGNFPTVCLLSFTHYTLISSSLVELRVENVIDVLPS